MTARVGMSSVQRKSITMNNRFQCPQTVDKNNWIVANDNYFEMDFERQSSFSVAQTRTVVTVTRTDENEGWGMNLKFKCCRINGKNLFEYFLHTYARL